MSDGERDLISEVEALIDRAATSIRAMYLWRELVEVRDQIRELLLPPPGDALRTRGRVVDVRALAASSLLARGGLRLDLLPPRIVHRLAALRAATTHVAGEVIAAVFARRRRRPSGLAIPEPHRRGEEQ